ncbi:MAG: macro domain-containing protein [Bdellovibrio sp.]
MNSVKTLFAVAFSISMISTSSYGSSAVHDYFAMQGPRGEKMVLSTQGTQNYTSLANMDLAPRGSAALTSSGDLATTGIKYIIHAASGAMMNSTDKTAPSLEGVRLSVINSIRIAEKEGIKKLAIPLIGGGIFLRSLNISKEELAYSIIQAARSAKSSVQLVFVAYNASDSEAMQYALDKDSKAKAKTTTEGDWDWLIKIWKYILKTFASSSQNFAAKAELVQGSIVDFKVHKAEAIVNAANMEISFGGGISGAIGQATNESGYIDDAAGILIKNYYRQNHIKWSAE